MSSVFFVLRTTGVAVETCMKNAGLMLLVVQAWLVICGNLSALSTNVRARVVNALRLLNVVVEWNVHLKSVGKPTCKKKNGKCKNEKF